MNNHQPIKLHNHAIKARPSSRGLRRRLVIGFLIAVIACVMTAWFGLLGWGLIELLRSLGDIGKVLWSTLR
jgi:hypothetical protein